VKVNIKELDVEMELKNSGVDLVVADPQGNHVGDLIVTKTKLIWCQGQTKGKNGKQIPWKEFIAYMNSL
jgi:hypothetical protein